MQQLDDNLSDQLSVETLRPWELELGPWTVLCRAQLDMLTVFVWLSSASFKMTVDC
jgi:hypothetical protein